MLPVVARISRFWRRISQSKSLSTASQVSPIREPLPLGAVFQSDAGRTYTVEKYLLDRGKPFLPVYCASAGNEKFVAKHTLSDGLGYQTDMQKRLSSSPYIRTFIDTVAERELCIYPYLADDLLQFPQKDMSKDLKRSILRMALTDIKPNNILIDYEKDADGQILVKKVQLTDLDDLVVVPPGKWLRGPLCGNQLWRSPESWCKSAQNHTSDVFSFGAVMIYVMTNEMIFFLPPDQLESEDPWWPILRRHMSYFGADIDTFRGFLAHIGKKSPFVERFMELFHTFKGEDARMPITEWTYLDPNFRDLLIKMMVMDPKRRISAKEALQHPWWNQPL